jgi:hypothetical protein
MPPLAASSISLRDPDTGLDITVLSVDPSVYRIFQVSNRGSSHQVLDGTQVHQFFGLKQMDFQVNMDVEITDYSVAQDLFTKAANLGKIWQLRDWFGNRFNVVFSPGEQAFNPTPIRGSCSSFECSLSFKVVEIVSWFGGGPFP